MLSILLNEKQYQIGQPLPDKINSVIIHYLPISPILYPKEQTPLIKAWFNTMIDNLNCEHVSFNDVLIPTSELNKF